MNTFNGNNKYGQTVNYNGSFAPNSYNPNFNANTPYANGFVPYNANTGFNQMQAPPVKTNHIYVTSLEDALARSSEPNSEIVYLHQDKPLLYNVKTDMMGRKSYTVLELHPPVVEKIEEPKPTNEVVFNASDFVGKAEFEEFKKAIQPLLDRINKSKEKAVETNG